MRYHAGAIVEKAVRRSGISIAELARRINVNRRSLYNWFDQEILGVETICKIGYVISYDFSTDFPDLQLAEKYQQLRAMSGQAETANTQEAINYWKNKYIHILEKYNELLSKQGVFSEEHAA